MKINDGLVENITTNDILWQKLTLKGMEIKQGLK
jgi:hypothetical protein